MEHLHYIWRVRKSFQFEVEKLVETVPGLSDEINESSYFMRKPLLYNASRHGLVSIVQTLLNAEAAY